MKRRMTTTLAMVMVSFFCLSLRSEAALKAEKVEYKQGSTVLTGYLVYEDSYPTPRPGVLVVHEWWGLNDYAKAKVLVCHGADDPLTTKEQIWAYQDNLRTGEADWQFMSYGGAKHSFTNPDADKAGIPALAYDKIADQRSWKLMLSFLDELFVFNYIPSGPPKLNNFFLTRKRQFNILKMTECSVCFEGNR